MNAYQLLMMRDMLKARTISLLQEHSPTQLTMKFYYVVPSCSIISKPHIKVGEFTIYLN